MIGELGGPVWQPDSGIVAGELQFDGIDDYVDTDFDFKLSDWPFSVIAWVKGGAPGQVVLSQIGIANWLLADPSVSCPRVSLDTQLGDNVP